MSSYSAYKQPRPSGVSWLWVAIFVSLAVGGSWWYWGRGVGLDPAAEPRAVTPRGALAEDEKANIEIYKMSSPSVVHIATAALRQDGFSLDVMQIPQGSGSGIIWDDEGHIVTNFHVIQGAGAARVTMYDQSSYDAKAVGVFPDHDLAVLTIDAPKNKLRPILIGASHDLQVGQKVFAIGNPFGLDQTLTTGIVSALGREIESVNRKAIRNVVQTDAAINPGNSGGPLLDSAGRLIGVNTAIYSPTGTSAGIGFAIPVDDVNRIVPQLIRSGKVTRPDLGIQPAEDQIMQRVARRLGVEGVLVMYVKPGSPAEGAGVRPSRRSGRQLYLGDIILAVNGKPVRSTREYYDSLSHHNAGDQVTLSIQRDDERLEVTMTLVAA